MRHARALLTITIGILGSSCSLGQAAAAPPAPADFLTAVGQDGMAFAASAPLAEVVLPADALARIRRMPDPPTFVVRRPLLQPIFGTLSCIDRSRCDPDGHRNGVWVIEFPGPRHDDPLAWVAVDGTTGGLWLWGGR